MKTRATHNLSSALRGACWNSTQRAWVPRFIHQQVSRPTGRGSIIDSAQYCCERNVKAVHILVGLNDLSHGYNELAQWPVSYLILEPALDEVMSDDLLTRNSTEVCNLMVVPFVSPKL